MTLPKLPFEVSKAILDRASQIKLAMFDVDGVLTDGKLHYGQQGEEIKVFHALDGHGLKMLQMAGISVAVISARRSPALEKRLTDLNIQHRYMAVSDKLTVAQSLQDSLDLESYHCCFTGDDVIDLEVMDFCGLAFSVENGHFIVKDRADWIAPFTGGNGAVRAICDVLLYSHNAYPLGHTSDQ